MNSYASRVPGKPCKYKQTAVVEQSLVLLSREARPGAQICRQRRPCVMPANIVEGPVESCLPAAGSYMAEVWLDSITEALLGGRPYTGAQVCAQRISCAT